MKSCFHTVILFCGWDRVIIAVRMVLIVSTGFMLIVCEFSNNTFTFVASLSLSYRTAYLYCYHYIVTPS